MLRSLKSKTTSIDFDDDFKRILDDVETYQGVTVWEILTCFIGRDRGGDQEDSSEEESEPIDTH